MIVAKFQVAHVSMCHDSPTHLNHFQQAICLFSPIQRQGEDVIHHMSGSTTISFFLCNCYQEVLGDNYLLAKYHSPFWHYLHMIYWLSLGMHIVVKAR